MSLFLAISNLNKCSDFFPPDNKRKWFIHDDETANQSWSPGGFILTTRMLTRVCWGKKKGLFGILVWSREYHALRLCPRQETMHKALTDDRHVLWGEQCSLWVSWIDGGFISSVFWAFWRCRRSGRSSGQYTCQAFIFLPQYPPLSTSAHPSPSSIFVLFFFILFFFSFLLRFVFHL